MVTLQPDWMVTRPRGPKASRSPVAAAVIQVLALAAAAALLLSLATFHLANTEIDSKSIMVVRYACMGCQGGPSYFSTMQAATSHYTNSRLCLCMSTKWGSLSGKNRFAAPLHAQ